MNNIVFYSYFSVGRHPLSLQAGYPGLSGLTSPNHNFDSNNSTGLLAASQPLRMLSDQPLNATNGFANMNNLNKDSPNSTPDSPKIMTSSAFQPHAGLYAGQHAPSPMKEENNHGFGSISAAAAAAAAMFGGGGPVASAHAGHVPGGPGVDLGADLRLSHPAITQWLQQAQAQAQAQAQQAQQQTQQDSPPSNDEPMDRESSPHSSAGGGPGSDYAAL